MTAPLPDLHLCGTSRQLALSLATIAASDQPADLIFLEDTMPVPAALADGLRQISPACRLHVTSDAAAVASFARLPAGFPALLRRNLSLAGGRIIRPSDWTPAFLPANHFAAGYFGHPGYFLSKCLAPKCDVAILREDGLSNYRIRRVPLGKAILRAVSGLPAFRQVDGEEPWFDRIEVSRPEDLPPAIRGKAAQRRLGQMLEDLPRDRAVKVAFCFTGGPIKDLTAAGPVALVLAQPLSRLGITRKDEIRDVYAGLIEELRLRGYHAVLKPHPREPALAIPGVPSLPSTLPVELWPYLAARPIDLAVALRSAALEPGSQGFARQSLQLIPARSFTSEGLPALLPRVRSLLAAALDAPPPEA